MKKILLATSILAATGGFAAAEVTIGGSARFGLVYDSEAPAGTASTIISNRVQFDIKGTTTTDGGVELGAKLRFRYNDGNERTTGNTAQFFASYEGVNVQLGNVDTGFDAAPLLWDAEMGFENTSFGDPEEIAFYYTSQDAFSANYMGVSVAYAVGGFSGMLSVADPDQRTDATPFTKTETSLHLAYASGPFAVAAAAYQNGAGINNNDGYFVGAAYTFDEVATVGLNYIDEDLASVGTITTLYGNYTMGLTTLRAYVADAGDSGFDTAYGLGADYDLGGGAVVKGSVQSGWAGETLADVGIQFKF